MSSCIREEVDYQWKPSTDNESEDVASPSDYSDRERKARSGKAKKVKCRTTQKIGPAHSVRGRGRPRGHHLQINRARPRTTHPSNKKHLAAQIAKAEEELRVLRRKNVTLQHENETFRDDLFRLLPLVQVPDTTIMNDYESLGQKIQIWIEEEIFEFEQKNPDPGPANVFSSGGDSDAADLLHGHPDAGEYLVRYRIYRYLQSMFGRNVYLFGLPTGIGRILRSVEESMTHLEPRRDSETVSNWRAETLNALSATKSFAVLEDQCVRHVTLRLFEGLCSIFPIVKDQERSKTRLYEQVMLPASRLAIKMQVLASRYEFRPQLPESPFKMYQKPRSVKARHLEEYHIVDVETHKTLKPGSAVVPDGQGFIGTILIPLQPRLVRVGKNGRAIHLGKTVYLVKLDQRLGQRRHEKACGGDIWFE